MPVRAMAIVWGDAFENTLEVGYPDMAVDWDRDAPGSEHTRNAAGVADAWVTGTEYLLKFVARWIPSTDVTTPYPITGWQGATGWQAFLRWARSGDKTFRVAPDRGDLGTYIESYLVEPLEPEAPGLERDATRQLEITVGNRSTPYDIY